MYTIDNNNLKIILNKNDYVLISINILVSFYFTFLVINNIEMFNNNIQLLDLLSFIIWVVLHEIIFFYIHKFLHNPKIYKYIHKYHHKYINTNVLTSFYAHPLDHVSVMFSFLIGPLITINYLNIIISYKILYLYIILGSLTFINSHNMLKNNYLSHHLIHHTKFNYNFGNYKFFDKLYNTYYEPHASQSGLSI